MYSLLKATGFNGVYTSGLYSDVLVKALAGSTINFPSENFLSDNPGMNQLKDDLDAVKPGAGAKMDSGDLFGCKSTDMFIQAPKTVAKQGKSNIAPVTAVSLGWSPPRVYMATYRAMQESWMSQVMEGVRILEVAEQTFVPAASAILAEWGAEVIKIEHVERGDSMRGLASSGLAAMAGAKVHVLLEHSNRGKQSLAVDLATPEGIDILYKLATTCDVFLTNKLPVVQKKLHLEVDDIRAHNPDIIYVCGTGQGRLGPEADRGAYDSLAYWNRSGAAMGATDISDEHLVALPAPAFGDSIGAMAIAGGIMGALYHRERTGEALDVDVSLLGVGMWSMGAGIALSLQQDRGWRPVPRETGTGNPLVGTYLTSDGRFIVLSCLQVGKYWPELCQVLGQPELATDPRFADNSSLVEHNAEAMEILCEEFASYTLNEWRQKLAASAVSGPSPRTRSKSRTTPRRRPTGTCRTTPRPTARRSSSSRRPCSSATPQRRRRRRRSSTSRATPSSRASVSTGTRSST